MDYSAVITAAIRKALLFNILGRICGRPIWQEESLASALQPAVPACQDNDLMSLPDSPAHRDRFDKFTIPENITIPLRYAVACESILDQSSLDPTLISEQIKPRAACAVANGLRDISLMPSISIISDYAINGEKTDVNSACNSLRCNKAG